MKKYDKYTNEYREVKLVAKKESEPFEMEYTIWIDGKKCDVWGNPIIEGLPKPTFNLYEAFKRGKTTKEVMDMVEMFSPNQLQASYIAIPYKENKEPTTNGLFLNVSLQDKFELAEALRKKIASQLQEEQKENLKLNSTIAEQEKENGKLKKQNIDLINENLLLEDNYTPLGLNKIGRQKEEIDKLEKELERYRNYNSRQAEQMGAFIEIEGLNKKERIRYEKGKRKRVI